LIRRIRYLEPNYTFRERWQYSNLMYVVAGYLAGYVEGTTWENLVEQRIFLPLGMTHSNTSVAEIQKTDNFAHPHIPENEKGAEVPFLDNYKAVAVEVPFYDYQRFGIGPNGAVNSSVDDMLKYLAFHLADGKVGGKQVVSAAQMQELHRPVTVIPPSDVSPARQDDVSYALGWFTSDYHGHKTLEHTGEITGFTSYMVLLPEEKPELLC
jgi:CubicO group peptidase (beta-lactamase class C family)